MIQILEKEIEGEILIFTNLRAVFWKRENALIIIDLHIGKSAHFRKNGIAIPAGILEKDLKNLQKYYIFLKFSKSLLSAIFFTQEET